MVSQPTLVTPTSSTLIDHIYTHMEEKIYHVSESEISISDHYAIFWKEKTKFLHR